MRVNTYSRSKGSISAAPGAKAASPGEAAKSRNTPKDRILKAALVPDMLGGPDRPAPTPEKAKNPKKEKPPKPGIIRDPRQLSWIIDHHKAPRRR